MPFSVKAVPEGGICGKCEWGQVMGRGTSIMVYCHSMMKSIPHALDSCSGFDYKGRKKQKDFDEVAWILEVKKGKIIGFKPPKVDKDD